MVRIWFGDLRVGKVSGTSGVFAGSNDLRRFRSAVKLSQAFGTANGESNVLRETGQTLEDRDVLDSWRMNGK